MDLFPLPLSSSKPVQLCAILSLIQNHFVPKVFLKQMHKIEGSIVNNFHPEDTFQMIWNFSNRSNTVCSIL